jgi:adenosine deaminase
MRPATLAELAAHYQVPVPPIRGFGSFTAFADQYEAATHVLRTEADLRRLVREVVEDAASAGAVWIEPQLYPSRYVESLGGIGEASDIVIDEGRAVGARLGVGFGLMIVADRTSDVAEAEELARMAAGRCESGVVAFGLANDEVGHPPEPFAKAFRIASEAGLISAPHAGELVGPESVIGALDALQARRIAHGVRAIEDPELVARLVAEQICLDVCPTSNLLLSVVPSLEAHPSSGWSRRAFGARSTAMTRCSSARGCSRSTSWPATPSTSPMANWPSSPGAPLKTPGRQPSSSRPRWPRSRGGRHERGGN